MSDVYKVLSIPLSDELMKTLDANMSLLESYKILMLGIIYLVFIFVIAIVIIKMQNKMENYYASLYIIPFNLIELNFVLVHHLKKLNQRIAFYRIARDQTK